MTRNCFSRFLQASLCNSLLTIRSYVTMFRLSYDILLTWASKTVSFTIPHRKKCSGVVRGDLAGHFLGPHLSMQEFENISFKNERTSRVLWAVALYCCEETFCGNISACDRIWVFRVCKQSPPGTVSLEKKMDPPPCWRAFTIGSYFS